MGEPLGKRPSSDSDGCSPRWLNYGSNEPCSATADQNAKALLAPNADTLGYIRNLCARYAPLYRAQLWQNSIWITLVRGRRPEEEDGSMNISPMCFGRLRPKIVP